MKYVKSVYFEKTAYLLFAWMDFETTKQMSWCGVHKTKILGLKGYLCVIIV